AERERREQFPRPRQPGPQQHDGDHLEAQQKHVAEHALRLEQAVADAGISGEHEVEERAEMNRAAIGEIEDVEEVKLARLIENAGDKRDEKAEAGIRTAEVGFHDHLTSGGYGSPLSQGRRAFYCAVRAASHSRSALASRGDTSGYFGSVPTVARIFHERAHLTPSARLVTTATPVTSGRRKASPGPSPLTNVAAEVMQTSARSTSTTASNRSSLAICTTGCASSDEPMRFCARSISSAPVTTRRTMRTLRHFSASLSSRQAAGTSGNNSRCTDFASAT